MERYKKERERGGRKKGKTGSRGQRRGLPLEPHRLPSSGTEAQSTKHTRDCTSLTRILRV